MSSMIKVTQEDLWSLGSYLLYEAGYSYLQNGQPPSYAQLQDAISLGTIKIFVVDRFVGKSVHQFLNLDSMIDNEEAEAFVKQLIDTAIASYIGQSINLINNKSMTTVARDSFTFAVGTSVVKYLQQQDN